jgi:Fe-S cluster assembly protein SufD
MPKQRKLLEQHIIDFFENNYQSKIEREPDFIKEARIKSFEYFKEKGFPTLKDEKWRKTNLSHFLDKYYHPVVHGVIKDNVFTEACVVPDLQVKNVYLVNGHYIGEPVEKMDNGIILGNIIEVAKKYPDLVKKYFNRLAGQSGNPIDALNTALFTGGFFLYVPEGITDFNLQISQKLDAPVDALINTRNLIVVEKGAKLNIIQCDDSNEHKSHFATYNTETFIEKKAEVNWYKYQNINNVSALFSNSFSQVDEKATFYTNFFQLNGKLLRNEQWADIIGKGVEVEHYGLYLTDKTQQFDNVIFIAHSSEGSYSNQKFKGILDDSAKAFFNGQILVKKDAQQTNAYQKNDNILLTDKAKISSQPFLEIYADDVSCSHGSTTGQLDNEALFYIMQRGISKRDAQLLQLYAFAGELIEVIKIPELIEPTKDLIKKRLNGELDVCENCILQCAVPTE